MQFLLVTIVLESSLIELESSTIQFLLVKMPIRELSNQGSRVRPIWSHVRPNFSRVRLTIILGRTGASSHSRKEKKKYPRLRNSVVQQKTPPLGLYRGLNQSEIVKGGPPL